MKDLITIGLPSKGLTRESVPANSHPYYAREYWYISVIESLIILERG